jgi:hypothetical protein
LGLNFDQVHNLADVALYACLGFAYAHRKPHKPMIFSENLEYVLIVFKGNYFDDDAFHGGGTGLGPKLGLSSNVGR